MTNPTLQQVLGGRYRLEAVLGQGGMGAVYAATDLTINRRVAIKLLRRELADDRDSLERMREEAVSLAALRHPNVVQLYDFHAATPETTFLLMELVEGESLSRRLERQGPMPLAVAVDYARQVLSALSAAHARGIIHRDIKPGNVLVMAVPMQKDLIKVLDFGIAKLTEDTIRRKPTTAGMLIGTPAYMSPEQAAGRPVDTRSDIYAAGLLLYTLLAGRNPFSGFELASTLVRVQNVDPPPLVAVRPDAGAALAEVLAVAMAKEPAKRFQTAQELVAAIDWATTGGAEAAPSLRGAVSTPPTVDALTARPSAAPPSLTAPQVGTAEATWTARGTTMPHGQSTMASATAAPLSTHAPLVSSQGSATQPVQHARSGGSTVMVVGLLVMGMALVVAVGALAYLLLGRDAPGATTATSPPAASADAAATPPPTSAAPLASAPPTSGTSRIVPKTTPSAKDPTKDSVGAGTTDRCNCRPTIDSVNSLHGRSANLGKRIVPLDCRCEGVGQSICPTEIRACSPKATQSGEVTPAGCRHDGFTECPGGMAAMSIKGTKAGEACSGWNSVGQKASGTLSCRFPESVIHYTGPKGTSPGMRSAFDEIPGVPCKGFRVDLVEVDGFLYCPR